MCVCSAARYSCLSPPDVSAVIGYHVFTCYVDKMGHGDIKKTETGLKAKERELKGMKTIRGI
jgi:hypothetical protein